MHWLCVTRTCCTVSKKPARYENVNMEPQTSAEWFGKLLVASCSYFRTILWHNLSVWFLMDSCWLMYKLIFKELCVHCWQEWIEFLVTQHWEWNISEKESGTCLTYITAAPNQNLSPVVIHVYRGQDHIVMNVKELLDLCTFMHFLETHISTMFHHLGSDSRFSIVKAAILSSLLHPGIAPTC
jgi:hypothetical protein